jgi:Chromatin assembly factor 1 subunit A
VKFTCTNNSNKASNSANDDARAACSAAVCARRPLAREEGLDYDYLSDEDWEEEPEGEDCAADDTAGGEGDGGEGDGGDEEDAGFVVEGARCAALRFAPVVPQRGAAWRPLGWSCRAGQNSGAPSPAHPPTHNLFLSVCIAHRPNVPAGLDWSRIRWAHG